jgi:hypothetical protein
MYFSIGNMLENESQQLPIVPNDQIKRKQMPFWSTPKGFYNWNIKKKKERKKQGLWKKGMTFSGRDQQVSCLETL